MRTCAAPSPKAAEQMLRLALAALLLAAPLAYMKQITALRHMSLIALGCVLMITMMIVI